VCCWLESRFVVFCIYPKRNDVRNVITHIRDRSRATVDEGHEAAPALAFQRRVVPPDPLGRGPFGVAPVELEAVISRHPPPQLLSFIRLHTPGRWTVSSASQQRG
jgi:hypothetical protein